MCFAFFKSWNSRLILLPISIQILIPPISKFEIDEQLGVRVTSWKSFVQKILVLLVLVLIHAVLFCGFGESPLVQLPNPIRIRTHVFFIDAYLWSSSYLLDIRWQHPSSIKSTCSRILWDWCIGDHSMVGLITGCNSWIYECRRVEQAYMLLCSAWSFD